MVSKVMLLVGIVVALSVNISAKDYGCERNMCWSDCIGWLGTWCWLKVPGAAPGGKGWSNIQHCTKDTDCNPDWPCADGYVCFWAPRVLKN